MAGDVDVPVLLTGRPVTMNVGLRLIEQGQCIGCVDGSRGRSLQQPAQDVEHVLFGDASHLERELYRAQHCLLIVMEYQR